MSSSPRSPTALGALQSSSGTSRRPRAHGSAPRHTSHSRRTQGLLKTNPPVVLSPPPCVVNLTAPPGSPRPVLPVTSRMSEITHSASQVCSLCPVPGPAALAPPRLPPCHHPQLMSPSNPCHRLRVTEVGEASELLVQPNSAQELVSSLPEVTCLLSGCRSSGESSGASCLPAHFPDVVRVWCTQLSGPSLCPRPSSSSQSSPNVLSHQLLDGSPFQSV